MKPDRAFCREPAGELDRVAALDRHVLTLALAQADDPPLEDVDRGNWLELAC